MNGAATKRPAIINYANRFFCCKRSFHTSTSNSWTLGLWMRKVKASSHTGTVVLYLVWKRTQKRGVKRKTKEQESNAGKNAW